MLFKSVNQTALRTTFEKLHNFSNVLCNRQIVRKVGAGVKFFFFFAISPSPNWDGFYLAFTGWKLGITSPMQNKASKTELRATHYRPNTILLFHCYTSVVTHWYDPWQWTKLGFNWAFISLLWAKMICFVGLCVKSAIHPNTEFNLEPWHWSGWSLHIKNLHIIAAFWNSTTAINNVDN